MIRGAFLLATTGKVTDSEAAWKLADMSKVLAEDDERVKGMEEVIAAVVKQSLTSRWKTLKPWTTRPRLFGSASQPCNRLDAL